MRTVFAAVIVVILLPGCADLQKAPQEDPHIVKARADYQDVHGMNNPPPERLEVDWIDEWNDFKYQALVRYPFAWLVTVFPNLLPYMACQAVVALTLPIMGSEYQDCMYDRLDLCYQNGVNMRWAYGLTPQWLGVEYDLVERDRREGMPQPLQVPASVRPQGIQYIR